MSDKSTGEKVASRIAVGSLFAGIGLTAVLLTTGQSDKAPASESFTWTDSAVYGDLIDDDPAHTTPDSFKSEAPVVAGFSLEDIEKAGAVASFAVAFAGLVAAGYASQVREAASLPVEQQVTTS